MLKILLKLIPSPIQKFFFSLITGLLSKVWHEVDKKIPKIELSDKNIKNIKCLLTREQLLELMAKNATVAEIGVDRGAFSEQILNICNPKKLHLIDVWETKRYNQNLKKEVQEKFKNEISNGQIEINIGYSTEVVDHYEENYFDWIYIDTNHLYDTSIEELVKYSTKMKKEGIIAGHDFTIGNWNGMVRYGVIEAVYEFCSKYDWEIIYLTMENKQFQSYALRKIQ